MKRHIEIEASWPQWKRDIAERLNATGVSMKEASTKAGLGETFVRDALKRDKSPSVENIAKLMAAITPGGMKASLRSVSGLQVLGTVQAGQFRDITLDEDHEPEIIHVPADPRFAHARQYALRVAGDSMNLEFPDGCYVTVVELVSSGLQLKPGHVVHVERYLGGAQHVETTLKEIQSINGQIHLVPRSTNPKHQPFIVTGDDDTEIKIRGIVTGKWEPKKL